MSKCRAILYEGLKPLSWSEMYISNTITIFLFVSILFPTMASEIDLSLDLLT